MPFSLSNLFAKVAIKTLARVDLPNQGSNQHEIDGVKELRLFFETTQKIKIEGMKWSYFADGAETVTTLGNVTFYDARANHPTRTEWRFYYNTDIARILELAIPGDILVLVKTSSEFFALVLQQNSTWLNAIQNLFDVSNLSEDFILIPQAELSEHQLDFATQRILDALDVEYVLPTVPTDEQLVEKFGLEFPSTQEMSAFARRHIDVNIKDADETLVRWLQREEELFRALEKQIVQQRLDRPFESVDDFIQFSLSVQNRRKSRMGYALENHLAKLFESHGLTYSHNKITEGKRTPDFIFPSIEKYHDNKFDPSLLTMLGVKSSCKERWRQVLPEAKKIPHKHLCTLEPGISKDQTDEMKESNLTLVIPISLHHTYKESQLKEIQSLQEFMNLVKNRQDSMTGV